jgi:hypothetical protein
MTIKAETMLNLLKQIHNDFQALTETLKFDQWHAHHRTAITLYSSIFEYAGSCITLIDMQQTISIPGLLRSLLEAHVDLSNLIDDASYGYNLEASCFKEWIKLLNEAKKGDNELIMSLVNVADETVTEIKNKYDEHKKNGYLPLTAKEKFDRAGMTKEYKAIFNMLSWDSHNNLNSLVRRHITQRDDDFAILIYKTTTPKDSAVYIALITEYFLRSTEKVHSFLNSQVIDKITGYRSILNKLNVEAEMQTVGET